MTEIPNERDLRLVWADIRFEMSLRHRDLNIDNRAEFAEVNRIVEKAEAILKDSGEFPEKQKLLSDLFVVMKVLLVGIISLYGLEVKLELPGAEFIEEMRNYLDGQKGE